MDINFNSFQQSCVTYICRNMAFVIQHDSFFPWILQLIFLTHRSLFPRCQGANLISHSVAFPQTLTISKNQVEGWTRSLSCRIFNTSTQLTLHLSGSFQWNELSIWRNAHSLLDITHNWTQRALSKYFQGTEPHSAFSDDGVFTLSQMLLNTA